MRVETYYLSGLEVRQRWKHDSLNEPGNWATQKQRFILSPSGERLAMVVDEVRPDALALDSNPRYYYARAYLSNTNTLAGLGAYSGYLAIAVTLEIKDFAKEHRRALLLALLFTLLLAFFVILIFGEHDLSTALRRSVALVSAAAFLTANCARTNLALQSPGYTVFGESLLYDELLAGVPPGMYFYHPNHLQSAVLITNARGEEELRIHYLPFGEIDQNLTGKLNLETGILEQTHQQVSIGTIAARYTDQTLDYEIELMYYNARYYDPQLGVFTSADNVIPDEGDPLAYNRHAYVRGNPIQYNDPTGHWWFVPFLIGVLIGGVMAGTGGNIAGWVNGDVAFNWDAAWKGALVGGFAAVAGVWASMAVAAGAPAAMQGTLGLAMAQGMMGGMASGFIGGAGGAWLNGTSFWDGLGYGILGGFIGAFSGMVLADVAHGLGKGGATRTHRATQRWRADECV